MKSIFKFYEKQALNHSKPVESANENIFQVR